MGSLFKFSMFITSFIPLWITVVFLDILSIVNSDCYHWTECLSIGAIFILNIFSVCILFNAIHSLQPSEFNTYRVIEAQQEKGITSEFLLSYVLPLFVFDFTKWDGVCQFLIYFVILGFLCIRNNNVYANLIFELKNYRFYTCEVQWTTENKTNTNCIVISNTNLVSKKGNVIKIAVLNKPFYFMNDSVE